MQQLHALLPACSRARHVPGHALDVSAEREAGGCRGPASPRPWGGLCTACSSSLRPRKLPWPSSPGACPSSTTWTTLERPTCRPRTGALLRTALRCVPGPPAPMPLPHPFLPQTRGQAPRHVQQQTSRGCRLTGLVWLPAAAAEQRQPHTARSHFTSGRTGWLALGTDALLAVVDACLPESRQHVLCTCWGVTYQGGRDASWH